MISLNTPNLQGIALQTWRVFANVSGPKFSRSCTSRKGCCRPATRRARARPHLIPALIRRESLEGLFGAEYKNLQEDEKRGQYALPHLVRLLGCWMAGDTLADMERALGTQEHLIGKCEAAREFVLRIVPELAYIFGLPGGLSALAAELDAPRPGVE